MMRPGMVAANANREMFQPVFDVSVHDLERVIG